MNRQGEWLAKDGLIIPKSVADKSKEDKEALKERFKKEFDKILSENSDVNHPYFIMYRNVFDGLNPSISRSAFGFYKTLPPLVNSSMVFWVDNSRGLCIWLWRVQDNKPSFNKEGVKTLKNVLRVAA